jgi:hypothetical protein
MTTSTTNVSVDKNRPDGTYTPEPLPPHHVPDGRSPKQKGVVAVGAAEPGRLAPSDITRAHDPSYEETPPAAPITGVVEIGCNEPGVLSPSEVTRRPKAS